ncbi:MAG: heavy-metal-associated domain-containing protein [Thermoleophilaceae bacterium]|nr:heavy-metal-associated domain-containing protein [Thermoleophilaceae bacterium]
MTETITYSVSGVSCSHCEAAIKQEVETIGGVTSVDVDLERKLVSIRGDGLDDAQLRAAIDEAGYDITA